MSEFKSYTDRDGNKVKIGDWIEISIRGKEVERVGKVAKITNKTFQGITVIIEGNPREHIQSKKTRKLVQKVEQVSAEFE